MSHSGKPEWETARDYVLAVWPQATTAKRPGVVLVFVPPHRLLGKAESEENAWFGAQAAAKIYMQRQTTEQWCARPDG